MHKKLIIFPSHKVMTLWLFCVFCRIQGVPCFKLKALMLIFSPFVFGRGVYMRDEAEQILKQELRFLALKTRNRLELTQKQMSELLLMNEKSYSDIETGVYMCGTLTCVFLIMMQEDPNAFLQNLRSKINKLNDEEILAV